MACDLQKPLCTIVLARYPLRPTTQPRGSYRRGVTMENQTANQTPAAASGMDRLVEKYRRQFRIPENLDHYSEDDFQQAEREYLRYCLGRGTC